MDTWAALFERATPVETDRPAIRERLTARRDERQDRADGDRNDQRHSGEANDRSEPNQRDNGQTDPTRLVAGANVLTADLLVGGPARATLDHVRSHDWLTLVASDPLLGDAEAVIADLADESLATAWRTRIDAECCRVEHPGSDHPALASAIAGDAGHVLTFDERLTSAKAGLDLRRYAISVRTPAAFRTVFDPGLVYEGVVGDSYPGPDSDPRG